jgi:quercetin dioxygenase-like cupin family protein
MKNDGQRQAILFQRMQRRESMAASTPPQSQLPPAEPMSLTEGVQYAPGSIVSRTLLKTDTGTLTLFAFDEGQELSEHTAPFHALVQMLDGTAILVVGGKPVSVQRGELVLMPANIPHGVRAGGRFKMLLTMFRTPQK